MKATDFISDVLSEIRENIKFLEAKNAAIITLNSALIAWGGSIVFDSEIVRKYRILVSIFVVLLFLPLIVSLYSFMPFSIISGRKTRSFLCRLSKDSVPPADPHKTMYYAYICCNYGSDINKYYNDIMDTNDDSSPSVREQQRILQVFDLAEVAYKKSLLFNASAKSESFIFVLGCIVTIVKLLTC